MTSRPNATIPLTDRTLVMIREMHVTELADHIGSTLGPTGWVTITQDQIDAFAEVTGDHQWVHVDVDRAAVGPFGTTIAHGYLTLSMIPLFLKELIQINGAGMGLNYGLDRVRFPAPVKVGSRIRAAGKLTGVERTADGAYQYIVTITFEIEGQRKPGCIAEAIFRRYADK